MYQAGDGAFRMRDYETGGDVQATAHEGGEAYPWPDDSEGRTRVPRCGDRVEVLTAEAHGVAATGGSLVGEVKQVRNLDGAYSFRVKLGGASPCLVWCSLEELKVVRGWSKGR